MNWNSISSAAMSLAVTALIVYLLPPDVA